MQSIGIGQLTRQTSGQFPVVRLVAHDEHVELLHRDFQLALAAVTYLEIWRVYRVKLVVDDIQTDARLRLGLLLLDEDAKAQGLSDESVLFGL